MSLSLSLLHISIHLTDAVFSYARVSIVSLAGDLKAGIVMQTEQERILLPLEQVSLSQSINSCS